MPSYYTLGSIGRDKARSRPLYSITDDQRHAAEEFLRVSGMPGIVRYIACHLAGIPCAAPSPAGGQSPPAVQATMQGRDGDTPLLPKTLLDHWMLSQPVQKGEECLMLSSGQRIPDLCKCCSGSF